MTALANWAHATTDIPERGLDRERAASDAEREQISRDLDLVSIGRLITRYRISAIAGGGWRLSGAINAEVVQSCIVTLEPVADRIEETFDTEFWEGEDAQEPEGEQGILDAPEVEPLEGGVIPVGRIVIETLSAALNPYPRKEGAEFDWQDRQAQTTQKSSPFAVLTKLKKTD